MACGLDFVYPCNHYAPGNGPFVATIREHRIVTNKTNAEDMKIIDAKLPLPWLIGSACAVVFSMGGVFVKLDAVGTALTKIEAKTDTRDDRISTLAQSLIQQQGKNDVQDAQVSALQNETRELRRDVEEVKKSIRWMPK